ncbi:MAG: phage baseplate assembly protein [Pseudomonadota bacterium]
MSSVQLVVGGVAYAGWKEISISRSLDMGADSFDLTLTDRWSEEMQRRPVRLGEPCQVLIDGEKVITGYIDRVRPDYDATRRSLSVSGRSKVADLVDCSPFYDDTAFADQFADQTLGDLARKLCQGFNIKVIEEVATKRIALAAVHPGEPVFEFLERYARAQAVRLTDDADGNLVITRASSQRITTALKYRENIKEASGEFSLRDRFSQYLIVGQHAGNDDDNGESAAHVSGRAEDVGMRYRPTTVIAETSIDLDEAKRRAEWQRNVAYGRSWQVTYTVNGWRHADGLWEPNRLVQVTDPWMGIDGEWLMIGTVEFVMDDRGQRTLLTVMPKEAYDLIPLPEEDVVT